MSTSVKRPQMDQVRAMILYQQGHTDTEIAQKLAVSSYTVQYWRKKNGLTANRPIRARAEMCSSLATDLREATRLGISYGQYKALQYSGRLLREEREAAIFAARRKRKAEREALKA